MYCYLFYMIYKRLSGRLGTQHTGGLGREEGTWGSNKSTESRAGAGSHPHPRATPPLTPRLKGSDDWMMDEFLSDCGAAFHNKHVVFTR